MRYSVELRFEAYDDDYTEAHYDFETKDQAMKFAADNYEHLYSVLDYEDRDHDPIDITP